MGNRAVFVELLKVAATNDSFAADIDISAASIRTFVDAGLAPLLCQQLRESDLLARSDPSQALHAASMTSRVMTRELLDNAGDVLDILAAGGIRVVVLKGISFATRYYSDPHLRVMGDLDLLLPERDTTSAEALLLAEGFAPEASAPGLDYRTHIHSAPLYCRRRKLWVEPHRRLIPDAIDASRETPLNLEDIERHLQDASIGERPVAVLSPEFELVYLATGWCRDLAYGFACARAQRGLVDLTMLLVAAGDRMDWDRVLRWSHGTQLGACLFLMLSFLQRLGIYDDRDRLCRQLGRGQPYVGTLSTAIIHNRLDAHVLTFGNFGRVSRPAVNQQIVRTLIQKRPAWRNIAALPWDVVFPPDRANRYDARRFFRRLAKLVGM